MAKSPTALPAFLNEEEGEVNVIVETPRGSRVKYAWDTEREIFVHKKLLPLGMVFPYDFGFVPSTKAEDGDPIDVLVLLDEPLQVGTLVEARLIGVIEAEQTEPVDGKKHKTQTVRNDRLLAIGKVTKDYAGIDDPRSMRPETIEQIQEFFIQYSKLEGREFKVLDVRGPKRAVKLVKQAMKDANSAEDEPEELKGAA